MTVYYVYYACVFVFFWLSRHIVFTYGSRERMGKSVQFAYSGWKYKSEAQFLTMSVGLLILLVGLRSQEMGFDLVGYLQALDDLKSYSWGQIFASGLRNIYQNYEVGYAALNKLITVLGGGRQTLLFVCAVLSLYPVGRMCLRYSRDTLFSLVIFLGLPCFIIGFSGLRQAIGIAITVCAYPYLREKKLIPFCAVVFLATLFHYSAFIFVLAYPIYHVRLSRLMAIAATAVLPVIWIARNYLFTIFSVLFKESATADNNGAVTLFFVFSLVYFFCAFYGNRKNTEVNGLSNLFFVACCIQALGGVYNTAIRVGYYFMIYLCLLLPEVMAGLHSEKLQVRRYHQFIRGAIMLCFVAFGLYSLRNGSWSETYPYSFFWM